MVYLIARSAFAFAILLIFTMPAHGAAPLGRFSASGGVVLDNKTGLTWQQGGATTFRDDYTNARTYCSNNTPALPGSGWRLPTIRELQSIIDYAAITGPSIDTLFFPNTQPSGYWTSTIYATDPSSGIWYVSFFDGSANTNVKQSAQYVRCVR